VNITNDQWFGDSAAPEQHFAMNVLRTLETRMGMVRAANTGISAVIDPYGFVAYRTPTFTEARFVEAVELGDGPTFYARHGDWIVVAAALALAGLGGLAFARGRRA
jgi:apolipoprotein N-acyltransferase